MRSFSVQSCAPVAPHIAVSLWLTVRPLSFLWKLCFPAPESLWCVRLVLGEPEARRYVRRQRREMKDPVQLAGKRQNRARGRMPREHKKRVTPIDLLLAILEILESVASPVTKATKK